MKNHGSHKKTRFKSRSLLHNSFIFCNNDLQLYLQSYLSVETLNAENYLKGFLASSRSIV